MLDKFSWLHLSDFHFRADGDTFSQNVSADEIMGDISLRLSSEYPLQFVAVTGDIAFSGRPKEYEVAAIFFTSLARKLGLGLNRIFLVPGNHDVSRDLQEYLYEGVRQTLTDEQAIDDFLGRELDRTALMERQSAFRNFQEQLFVDAPTSNTDDGLARVRLLELDGLRVCVLELNSAWLSGSKDQAGRLLIGDRQIINALALAKQHRPHLMIALAHHPMEWISEFDRLSCNRRLVPHLNIFHSGHLHHHEVSVMLTPGAECLRLAAGSSHASRHYENSYNLVEFEVGAALGRIRTFQYKPKSGGFEETPSTKYKITLGGTSPAELSEIACVLRGIEPAVDPYVDYFAALLAGEMNEVPIQLNDGSCTFASRDLSPEFPFAEVQEFLRIPNMLRVYDDVPLNERLATYSTAISRLTELLTRIATENYEFAGLLAGRVTQAKRLARRGKGETPPYQIQYLDDLARANEWAEVVNTSKRYMESSVEEVRIAARRQLSWALLQAEEQRSRNDGLILAYENLDESWADCKDNIVASVAAELLGDYERAMRTALSALEHWPHEPTLREHCRSLAMKTGSKFLRQRLDETRVSRQ